MQQEAAAAAPPATPAPAPASNAPAADDMVAQLRQLADLKAQGVLSEAEFENAKAKLLS
jgi:hypothetical protein